MDGDMDHEPKAVGSSLKRFHVSTDCTCVLQSWNHWIIRGMIYYYCIIIVVVQQQQLYLCTHYARRPGRKITRGGALTTHIWMICQHIYDVRNINGRHLPSAGTWCETNRKQQNR